MFNLLNAALSLIPEQPLEHFSFIGRDQNELGQWISRYKAKTNITGSFQPIEKAKYEALGLDMNKHYFVLFSSTSVQAVGRGTSGDLLIYGGRLFQAEDEADWRDYNGWQGIVCVEIGDPPESLTAPTGLTVEYVP